MRKLFLSLFAALLIYGSVQFVNAAAFEYKYTFNGHNYFGFLDYNFSTSATYGSSGSFLHPFGVLDSSGLHVFVKSATSLIEYRDSVGQNQNVINVGYINNDVSSTGRTLSSSSPSVVSSNFPVFNNFDDAFAYGRGQSYNVNSIIAGTVPYQNTFSSDRQYQPYINFADIYYGYEDFFGININGLTTTLDMQLREPAQVPNYTNSRVQLVYYIPTSLSLDTFIADYDMGSGIFMASSIETFMKEHPDFRYNNNLTYESHSISKNVDFSSSTRFTDTISDYSVWGDQQDLLYNQLLSIYDNSSQKALYAYLLLMRYDYVSVAHYSDNTITKVRTVYPAGFYYFNLYNYDNTLYKKRGVPVSPSVGTGSSAPSYENPQNPNNYTGISDSITDSLQDQLTQSINDSHNSSTVINNYYQGLDQRIDQFEDGTLNIDDTISNVVSVAKSVSHIGLIFGYLFNGFLPAEVITLLGFAFVLIPIVVIIKLIRG